MYIYHVYKCGNACLLVCHHSMEKLFGRVCARSQCACDCLFIYLRTLIALIPLLILHICWCVYTGIHAQRNTRVCVCMFFAVTIVVVVVVENVV